ncbi:hypothetical protein Ae201684_011223 [Aphanomyces euteiches]|uniref:Uncharacterized protein n=1 Tax=Aphanomyces euteiches TaxID=100861 RepID=A0A6G0WVN7_9STRA|nr:hypothetical protein Ae201684_011223 [Aphanomyces euteiches]KAH9145638.1 hypothetical protein AeRB84_010449 [Aphanomyces euteiches]
MDLPWEEFDVAGNFVGVQLKLRLRLYEDCTCGVEVLECPEEVGYDNLVIWDTSYSRLHERRHLQGFVNISTPVVAAKLRFVGVFDENQGLHGKWFHCWNTEQTGSFRFEPLGRVTNEHTRNASPLCPLIPGQYIFIGAAVGGNGRIYHSHMNITLLEDGRLCGHAQERLFPQMCSLDGQWSPTQMSWSLAYTGDGGNVNEYVYFGMPSTRLLRGMWQLSDVGEIESLARESGRFEYELRQAHRRWSRSYHHTFPSSFRQIARTILFSKAIATAVSLPSDMWCHVFSFVHAEWFPAI